MEENVEFVVKPTTALLLKGKERSIVRVFPNTPYSCLMSRTQRLSSLFRHYAKHHGLKRDTLCFFFTEILAPDDTPESIHLQNNDVVYVKQAQEEEDEEETESFKGDNKSFIESMRDLLDSAETTGDIRFEVGEEKKIIRAHSFLLMARTDYFNAMLQHETMKERKEGVISVPNHSVEAVSATLEFIYSNQIVQYNAVFDCLERLRELLQLTDFYLLPDLKQLVSNKIESFIDEDTVLPILFDAITFTADTLRRKCIQYVAEHPKKLLKKEEFGEALKSSPDLSLMLLSALADIYCNKELPPPKRRRIYNFQLEEVN